jgi:hypothetical protein
MVCDAHRHERRSGAESPSSVPVGAADLRSHRTRAGNGFRSASAMADPTHHSRQLA